MYNSTNFLRLTLSQYGKAFWFICYTRCLQNPGVNICFFRAIIAEPSLYLSIDKIGLSPKLYHLLIYSKWPSYSVTLTSPHTNDWD